MKNQGSFPKNIGIYVLSIYSLLMLAGCGGGGGSNNPSSATVTVPTAVAIVPGDKMVTLSWDGDAASYNVYSSTESGVTKDNWAGDPDGRQLLNAANPVDVASLENGKKYYFVITGVSNGNESEESSEVAAEPSLPGVIIKSGHTHACALLHNKSVSCWGENTSLNPAEADSGRLGNGSSVDSATPVPVSGITTASQIGAGNRHSCAVLDDGSTQCWGNNNFGQLGDGTTNSTTAPVTVTGINNAVHVAAGDAAHTCAILSNGAIKCWGWNVYGQLGNNSFVIATTPVDVMNINNALTVEAGFDHTCALQSDGAVSCWGNNQYGQLGDGSTSNSSVPLQVAGINNAIAITAGGYHTCALLGDNTLKCWGLNGDGQLGDGQLPENSPYSSTPIAVSGLNNVIDVSAGYDNTCAVQSDGIVKCWGKNDTGKLGDGTFVDSVTPIQVHNITNATEVETGGFLTCVLVDNDVPWCWGRLYGTPNDNSYTDYPLPIEIPLS